MRSSETVLTASIEPEYCEAMPDLLNAVEKLGLEDASLRVTARFALGIVLGAGGEPQLRRAIDRLKGAFGLRIAVGEPTVRFRETVHKSVEQEGTFIREISGRRRVGLVRLRIEPQKRGVSSVRFPIDKRKLFAPEVCVAVKAGVQEVLDGGVFGFPVVGIQVSIVDASPPGTGGDVHPLRCAAVFAMRSALSASDPVLLEPIMRLELTTPKDSLGDVMENLNKRRALLVDIEDRGNLKVARLEAPLAEILGFSEALRTLAGERAAVAMRFSHYEERRPPKGPPGGAAGRPVRPKGPSPHIFGSAALEFPEDS